MIQAENWVKNIFKFAGYLKIHKNKRGKFGPAANFFVLELLGLTWHSKDAFFAEEYDARKIFSKFDQRTLGLTVLKFRKFEFRKCKSKWI